MKGLNEVLSDDESIEEKRLQVNEVMDLSEIDAKKSSASSENCKKETSQTEFRLPTAYRRQSNQVPRPTRWQIPVSFWHKTLPLSLLVGFENKEC